MKKATLTEDKAEKTPTGGVLVGKREGQTIIHNKGTLSGYLVGKTHAEGGIKAINKSTGQPLEMQGGEVVITAPAVSDNTKREFEGKMMTNREILSTINEKGGGVAFAKDGMEIPKTIKRTGASYKYGGKTMTDHEIYKYITGGEFNSKPFLDYYFQEIKDFLEEQNNIKLKEDYTFRYIGKMFTIDPFIKADKNSDQKIKSADFIIYDSEGEVIGEISFNPNNKNKFNANSDFFEWNNIKFANGGMMENSGLILYKEYTGKEVKKYLQGANYKDDSFFEYIKNSDKYILKNIEIDSLLIRDSSLKTFIDTTIDTMKPNENEYEWRNKFPIVVGYNGYDKENVVLDGYHRITQSLVNKEDEILGFVKISKAKKYEEGGLIAPNGHKTNLTPEQYKLVRTPEFKAWFGDWENDPENASKVVDENGEPMICYHGAYDFGFTIFSKKTRGISTGSKSAKKGFFFYDKEKDAKMFSKRSASGGIYEVFLKIKIPNIKNYDNQNVDADKELLKLINSFEYDGAIALNLKDGYEIGNQYIVFEPEQIKLADGSNTTFDGSNPDIRFDDGGSLVKDSKSGNTPARDLNNYNDVLDLQADSMVGADTGLFNDGGMMARGGATDVIVDNWDDIPDTFKNVRLPKKIDWLPTPDNDGLFEIAKPFLSKDSLRPALQGMNFDDNGITFTNSHILLTIPTTNNNYQGIYKHINIKSTQSLKSAFPEGFVKVNATYPKYENVIRKEKDNVKVIYIDILKLLTYCKVARNYSGKNEITFKINDSAMSFNADYIIDFLSSLIKLDDNTFWYVSYNSVKEALVFTKNYFYELGKDIIGLIMPYTFSKRTDYGTQNDDKNAVLNVYFDFDDNEIHNADGSINNLIFKPTTTRAKRTPKTTPSQTSKQSGKFTAGEIDMFSQIDAIVEKYNITNVAVTDWMWDNLYTRDFDIVNTITGEVLMLRSYKDDLGVVADDQEIEKSKALIEDYLDFKKSTPTSVPFDLKQKKIWIGKNNNALSKRIQEKAMELGWDWWGGSKNPVNLDFDNLFFDVNEKITSASDRANFDSFSDFKEITEADLFGTTSSQTSKQNLPVDNEDWVKKFTADLDKIVTYLPNDIDFAPELSKERKDLENLKKLLPSFQQSKYAVERAKILKEIKKLHYKLTYEGFIKPNEALSSDANLFTPQGLLDYYFTQATQNPTADLEPACELITPNGEKSKLPLSAYLNVRTPQFKNWFGDWEKAYETGNYVNCSKMIDPDTKEPKIYFHGVRKYVPNFGQFSNMGQGVTRPYGSFEPPNFNASFFAGEEDYAKFYGGLAENMPTPSADYKPFIYKVFLSVKNPISLLPLDFMLSYKDFMDYIYVGYGVKVDPNQELLKQLNNDIMKKNPMWIYVRRDIGFIEKLKDYGYDAIFQIGDIPTFLPNGQVEPDRTKHLQEVEYLTFYPSQVKSATVKKSFYFDFFNDIRFKNGGYVRI